MRLTAEEEKMSDAYQSLSHSKLQIPCGVRAQATAKGAFRTSSSSSGRSIPCAGPAERVPDSGRTSAAGSCAYVYRDSPQASGGFGDRVPQGEERYCHCPTVWQRTQLRRGALLGPGLCGLHRRLRVRANPPIHPRPRGCGWIRRQLVILR